MSSFIELKTRQRKIRDQFHENLGLRVHRSLSWLERAELADDDDGRYIFLWIAFNAAYAQEQSGQETISESRRFEAFIGKIVDLDTDHRIYNLLWQEFSASVRVLLKNKFVFNPFWEFQQGTIPEASWLEAFDSSNARVARALGSRDTKTLLSVVLTRLYTLRNQLIHGGATWNSKVNRDQLRDATAILGKLVPVIIELMMDNADTLWGDASYPVVAT